MEFFSVLWHFVAVCSIASTRSLQLLAFITIQPGTDATLAPTDKISLASLVQALCLTGGYYTGNTWRGAWKESYRFYRHVVSVKDYFNLNIKKHRKSTGSNTWM